VKKDPHYTGDSKIQLFFLMALFKNIFMQRFRSNHNQLFLKYLIGKGLAKNKPPTLVVQNICTIEDTEPNSTLIKSSLVTVILNLAILGPQPCSFLSKELPANWSCQYFSLPRYFFV